MLNDARERGEARRVNIQLYAIKLDRALTDEEAHALMACMPSSRRRQVSGDAKVELRQEPLCAYALLALGMRTLCGWDKLPKLRYSRYGKPEFDGHPEFQFNISYTRQAALVGIHDEPIGVDIEKIRPVSERAMQRIAGTSSRERFFASWVRRECRSKWSGAGLSAIREEESPYTRGEKIVFLDTFPGYAACLCTHSEQGIDDIKRYWVK